MGQGCFGGAVGGLSVADRMALLEARQDLAWERLGHIDMANARARGDESAYVRANAMNAMGIDAYIDMVNIRALVESGDPTSV